MSRSASPLRIELLGPLRVDTGNATPLGLPSATQRRLVSILALEAGHVVTAARLCELLECSPGSLRTSVSRLRSALGPEHLATAAPGYLLHARSDAAEFEQLLSDGRASTGAPSIALFEHALGLWRGEALEEFRDEFWAVHEVERLDELRAVAVEQRAEAMLAEEVAELVIAEMPGHIARHPLRERPRSILMRALVSQGRTTEALRVYQDLRRLLAEQSGTEPSDELRSLEHAIAAGTAGTAGGQGETAAGATATTMLATGQTAFLVAEPVHLDPRAQDLMTAIIRAHHGVEILTAAGTFAAAFDTAAAAVGAAIAAQQTHAARPTAAQGGGTTLRVGVHVGPAVRRDDTWSGPTLDETVRMASVGHPGQIVVSGVVAAMIVDATTDLGEHHLPDITGARRLFQVDVPGASNHFPPLRSIRTQRSNLPAQRTRLIGRTELVRQLRELIAEHRLVSLIGPGGVGKTRLAIEAAGRVIDAFPGGVVFVDLTDADTPADVSGVLLRSLSAPVRPGQSDHEAVAEFMVGRTALVVCDNCEHVIDRAAEMIDEILVAAPDVRVLATSREPLRLHGERRFIVPSLDVEGPDSAGARLFAERARATDEATDRRDRDVDPATIAQIARRLDGIPLAIELAAAQTATLSAAEILELLDDRFSVLAAQQRRVPLRQQTLAATVAWSYDLLDAQQQAAFRALTACAGAFSVATASRVLRRSLDDTEQLLGELQAKSVIVPAGPGGAPRGFTFLETLRDFGRARAAQAGETEHAMRAVEHAVAPTRSELSSWTALVNEYICSADASTLIEDLTRLAAAASAQDAGRLDEAAFIFSSVAYRDEIPTLRARVDAVAQLAGRRSELDPMAWLAANAAQLLVERAARDYGAVMATAGAVTGSIESTDPAHSWFDLWRCALTTAVAPEAGLAEIELALPRAERDATPPLDWTVSQFLSTKSTGLALLQQLDEADRVAAEAVRWAPVGQESRDQSLALRAWLAYLRDEPVDPELVAAITSQPQDVGLAELSAAPGALHSDGTVEQRAARVVAVARGRPDLDIATPHLLAFAFLALERGEHHRARRLVANAELYDASTQVAIVHAHSIIDDWPPQNWAVRRDEIVAQYLHPDHEAAAELGASALEEELERWEQLLAEHGTGQSMD